ncbi:MAG: peptidoglycan DD-metalloendopeptidase family protein [Elusimicrobiota bacterium]
MDSTISSLFKDGGALAAARPWLRRLTLYGSASLIAWAAYAYYLRLCEAGSIEHDAQGVQTYTGELGGRNLENRLLGTGSTSKEAAALLKSLSKTGAGRAFPGDNYELVRSTDDRFLHLTVVRGLKRTVVTPKNGGFQAVVSDVPVLTTARQARGDIRGNLWLSMQNRGVPPTLISEFADTFQWTVDFLTETHDGDRFAVSWTERHTPDGRNWGRTIEAGLYDGRVTGRHVGILFGDGYYDEKGHSLARMFLRAPLNYRRISSYFSSNRYHPILRRYRPHHGTDYAAPYGTPVSAVGAGLVAGAGYKGGLGNAVEIRHNSNYVTVYGHLKGFAKGVRAGTRVRQGQVIGYVGATGLASGPHLHFQISRNGQWINFLSIKVPQATSVPAKSMPSFQANRDRQVRLLGETGSGVRASAR